MSENPLLKLPELGQSLWIDLIRRGMFARELPRMIEEDGLRGVTSNPAIFEKAIAGSHDYDEAIRSLALEGKGVAAIYEALVVWDIRRAADLFRPVYDRLDARDGFVCLEVSPHLAHDTEGTIAEARRLWNALGHPNVMIKVPATPEGLPAITRLTAEGINVNVTLLFGLSRYRAVAESFLKGLEERAARGETPERIASVASFFLSRIDVLVDPMLERATQEGGPRAEIAKRFHGMAAIASAKVAYRIWKEIFGSDRFRALAARGARPQRLLWASTSPKNPVYSDVKYIEPLIGPETITTVPIETLNAYRDHGRPALRLEQDVEEADEVFRTLPGLGIDPEQVARQLEDEGVAKFNTSFDRLMSVLQEKRKAALGGPVDRQMLHLGEHLPAVQERIDALVRDGFCARLWRKDPELWKVSGDGARNALGWLHVAEKMEENLPAIRGFVAEVKEAGFRHVVHMGMGGSSLAPLVFQRTFPPGPGGLPLTVLDTTDPATILKIDHEASLGKTLFIIASKSGTTAEPLAFGEYFYSRIRTFMGERAGECFVAITDPGTPFADLARQRRFRRVFTNYSDIGGRYSALSWFGLLPVALLGVDPAEVLSRALRMAHACASCVAEGENPGIVLGAALGEMALRGFDKVTFLIPESIASLGMWLEQLLAESTGKNGKGLLPVTPAPFGEPAVYGNDRLFVHVALEDEIDQALEQEVARLRETGSAVITILLRDRMDLSQEFFRWEVATAVAGAVLGIDPFDQPNVQESKDNTNRLLALVREKNVLPEGKPAVIEGPLSIYVTGEAPGTVAETLRAFLGQARPRDYLAVLAYLTESPVAEQMLQAVRVRLRDNLQIATTLGYGPRYLHSTGQYHKGGPDTGLFLLLTAEDKADAFVPGQPYTFGVFRRAQALGDLEALRKRGRRVMRIHLGGDVDAGLDALDQALDRALDIAGAGEES